MTIAKNRWYNYLIMKKKSVWVKKRHNTIRHLVEKPIYRYLKKNYGFSYTPFDTNGQAYLILANHQTAMDQFIVQLPFKDYCYPIASEDIFSIALGKAIAWAVAPIPITKGQINVNTILTCKQIAKQNKSIQLHPEGNRTYSGKTEYIAPAIAKLAKVLKLPIAFLVIRGGYGVRPRWSEKPRKGQCHAKVESVLLPEQYLSMTDEELYKQICQRLYVNESNDNGETFDGDTLAEYLERAIYYCPNCGVTHFYSNKNSFKCTTCDLQVIYQPNKQFATNDGSAPPYRNVNEWYEAQKSYVCKFVPTDCNQIITQDKAKISKVILMKRKQKLCSLLELTLYPNRLVAVGKNYSFDKSFDDQITGMSVLGKNKLNIICKEEVLQIEGDKRFNALKYANFFYRYKNFKEGKNDISQFLGL